MKYFVIFLILIGSGAFLFGNHTYGLWVPLSPEELIEQSKTIFVGTVTAVNTVDVEYQSQIARNGTIKESVGPEVMTLEEYTVEVEEFLKNPQDSNTIKVLRATVGGVPSGPARISGFENGDRVLFYLPKDENQTHFPGQYLPESFMIPKECNAKTVLNQTRIELTNSFNVFQDGIAIKDNYTAGIPMNFVYSKDMHTLFGEDIDVVVSIRKEGSNQVLFERNIHSESESCQWIASAQWEFTPEAGNYRMYLNIKENEQSGGDTSYTGFSVISELQSMSPLKQIKNGIALFDVVCSDNKIPAYKHDNMSVACVTEETHSKLINRGWALLRFAMPDENPSHVLCNRYDGKWHPEYEGCRGDISDLQCSLMGGKFVDGLKICYNGICPVDKTYTLCVTNPDLYLHYPQETVQELSQRCGPSSTLRGPTPTPTECESNLVQCIYVCGDLHQWVFRDSYGKIIDQSEARKILENEN